MIKHFFLSSRLAQVVKTSVLKSYASSLGPEFQSPRWIIFLCPFFEPLPEILLCPFFEPLPEILLIFSGNGSKNGQKPGKTFRPKNLGSKFSQIFRVTAQSPRSPGQIFRGFVKNRLFGGQQNGP